MPKITLPAAVVLIDEGAEIKARIKADTERLKEIEATLMESLAPGKHPGTDGVCCTIIAPESSLKLKSDDVDEVRATLGDDSFKKLFDRTVSFKPVKSFREVLAALADGKRVANKVLALMDTPSSPSVKWAA